MSACTQALQQLDEETAKCRKSASSDTGGSAASDTKRIEELEARLEAKTFTYRRLKITLEKYREEIRILRE